MATTNISIRMDSDLKSQADALFSELGMNLSTAFNIFVRQSLRDGGIPFEIKMDHHGRYAGGRKDRKGPECKALF